jgi:hypothetical protein
MNLIKANSIEWAERKSTYGKSERASLSIGRAMKAQEAGHPFENQLLQIPRQTALAVSLPCQPTGILVRAGRI